MRDHHPEFRNYLNCSATHAWVVDSYDPRVPTQLAALQSVCEQCNVVAMGKDSQLVRKCQNALASLSQQ